MVSSYMCGNHHHIGICQQGSVHLSKRMASQVLHLSSPPIRRSPDSGYSTR